MFRPFLLCLLLGYALNGAAEQQDVQTAPVLNDYVEMKIRTFGVLAPKVEDMSFQIAGRISRFEVEEGGRVSAGQLLVALDKKDAEDQLSQARTELDDAVRVLQRMKTLRSSGSIQISQLEEAQARFDLVLIAFNQAELNLERCDLRAPSDGIILKQIIDSRTSVSAGQRIYIFQSDDEPWITKVDLTDRNALMMSRNARADVYFSPYPNDVFEGVVTRVAQVANPKDGLYTAEIAIKTKGKELRPGMVAEVDLIKRSERKFSIVPFDALLDLRKRHGHVYVVSESGTVALEKSVTVNIVNGDQVSLVEDLSTFERVIIRGHHGLQDQTTIQITD